MEAQYFPCSCCHQYLNQVHKCEKQRLNHAATSVLNSTKQCKSDVFLSHTPSPHNNISRFTFQIIFFLHSYCITTFSTRKSKIRLHPSIKDSFYRKQNKFFKTNAIKTLIPLSHLKKPFIIKYDR